MILGLKLKTKKKKKHKKIAKILMKITNSQKFITNSELPSKNHKNKMSLISKIIIKRIVKLKLQLIEIKNISII